MIRILWIVIVMLMITFESSPLGLFKHYKAAQAYRCNDNAQAQRIYEELITEDIKDYQALYNAGKAAYQQKDFVKAESYFNHTALSQTAPTLLRKQAWFDQGNTQIHQNKLQEALDSFKKVLSLDEHHKEAQEMIEAITKHIQQEKQAQEEQKQDEQNNQKEHNQKPSQSNQSSNKDNQSSGKGDKKDSPENQDMKDDQPGKGSEQGDNEGDNQHSGSDKQNQQGEQQSNKKNGSEQQSDQDKTSKRDEQKQSSDDANNPNQEENKTDNEQGEDNNFDNQEGKKEGDAQRNRNEERGDNAERNKNGTPSDKLDGEQGDKKHQDRQEHNASPSQGSTNDHDLPLNNSADKAKEQDDSQLGNQLQSAEKNDGEMPSGTNDELFSEQERLLLQMIDDHDAQISKMLLKEEIKKGMPAQHGYKNW